MDIRHLLQHFMARNSDPNGKSLRVDDSNSSVKWDLKNQELIGKITGLIKKPIHSEILRIFTDKRIPDSYVEASREIEKVLSSGNVIPLSILPVNLQCIDQSNPDEVQALSCILNLCANYLHSERGDGKILSMTSGRFSKIHCYRIMKCATSSMFGAIQDVFVGREDRRCYLPSRNNPVPPEWTGFVGEQGTVNFCMSPLACATRSFNFSQSHFPIMEYNQYPESVYRVISLRDPLSRIASFYNMIKNDKFESIYDFVENCHPHFIFGQLYFCDQDLSLFGAMRSLVGLDRVLIVEKSKDWSDILSADLSRNVSVSVGNRGNYVESASNSSLRGELEKLLVKRSDYAFLLDKEYKLYEFAKSLV